MTSLLIGDVLANVGAVPRGLPAPSAASYGRGDADCDLNHTASDLVATVADLGGEDRCANGDCDRDGDRDAADIDCALGCLFGVCPIPPGAPVVEAVVADTADAIVPFSTIRLLGSGFGDDDTVQTVTIGGLPAEVVETTSPTEIFVVVPDVAPGATEVVVTTGEIAGAAAPMTVAAAPVTGDPFRFLTLLDGLNDIAAEVQARGIEGLTEADGTILRNELGVFRETLFLAYDDALAAADSPAELQARLALAAESSGLIDRLADLLQEIRAPDAAVASGPAAAAVPRETIKVVARSVTSGARTVVAAAPGAGARAATVGLGSVVSGLATLLGVAAAAQAGIDALADTPLIASVENGGEVVPGESFDIVGRGFGAVPPLPVLRVDLAGHSLRIVSEDSGESAGRQFLRFRLPVAAGVCGRGQLRLERELFAKTSAAHPLRIKPRIVEVNPDIVELTEDFTVNTRGVVGCRSRIGFSRQPPGAPVAGEWFVGAVKNHTEVVARAHSGLVPDRYDVFASIVGIISGDRDDASIRLLTDLDGLFIVCPTPDGGGRLRVGQTTRCTAGPFGGQLPSASTTDVSWALDGATDAVAIVSTEGDQMTLRGERGGVVTVEATLRSDTGQLIATTAQAAVLEVADDAPEIAVRSPDRQAPQTVPPATVLQIIATATDDAGLDRLVLQATGDAVVAADRMQEVPCIALLDECETTFAVELREDGFSSDEVRVTVTAVDTGGNESVSDELVFKVAVGAISGRVVDAADGSPIEDAIIRVLSGERFFLLDARTDADGNFTVREPAGASTVNVGKQGFRPSEVDIDGDDRQRSAVSGKPIDIAIELVPLGTDENGAILGTVRHGALFGDPIAAATVTITDVAGRIAGFGVTGDDGAFRVDGLLAADYVVRTAARGFADYSTRRRASRFPSELVPQMRLANPACRSDESTFELISGHGIVDGGRAPFISFGEARLDDPLAAGGSAATASFFCLGGSASAPVISWHQPTVGGRDRLSVVSEGETLYAIHASDGAAELLGPITYGSYAGVVGEPPMPPGTLLRGVEYELILTQPSGPSPSLNSLRLVFRIR